MAVSFLFGIQGAPGRPEGAPRERQVHTPGPCLSLPQKPLERKGCRKAPRHIFFFLPFSLQGAPGRIAGRLRGLQFLVTESAGKRLVLSVRKHLYRDRGSGGKESIDGCGFTDISVFFLH